LNLRIAGKKAVLVPTLLLHICLPGGIPADSVKPVRFGPFIQNHVNLVSTPAGYDYALTNGNYHFQIGWVEPISTNPSSLFYDTYIETNGNLNLSLFQSDIGTTFKLKPIRYLELGLSYNRLIFNQSMVTFKKSGDDLPPADQWRPTSILRKIGKEPGGADVFTYHANFTLDIKRVQFFVSGSYNLWDIDTKGDYVYEYSNDLLISPRDRVKNLEAQINLDTRPYSLYRSFSYTGFSLRNQFWAAVHTDLKENQMTKNLVSFGITGFRMGRNPEMHRRGLDLLGGYWLLHNQIPKDDWVKSLVLIADWRWNIQFLSL
jgi:hypothetical protein